MRVTIPDAVIDPYQTYADRQGIALDAVLTNQLRRFASLEPGKRAIVIPADLAETLAERLGGLPLKDGADLLARLDALAGITFADVRIPLSAAQAEELAHRAARQGRPVEALVRDVVAKITEDLFWVGGGGVAAETAPPLQKVG